MPFVTSSIPWVALNTTNAFKICDMTCVVEPSMGLLLVIGGSWAQDPSYEGFQVYNFKTDVWNEALYLVGYPSEIGIGIFQPRSVLIEPGIVLIWGGTRYSSTFRVIYKLNMTVTPWKWEPIMTTVLNSVGIARSRERVFIFGGIDKVNIPSTTVGEGVPMNLSYIYDITKSQILKPDYQLPFAFTHSVVGVVGDFMYIVVFSYNDFLENRQMSIIPLNLAQLKFETSFETSSNSTKARLRAAGVQPPGSDVILVKEILALFYVCVTYQNSSLPDTGITSDTMLVYNMTLRSWTDTVNLVTDASAYHFAFPKENLSQPSPSVTPTASNLQNLQWPTAAIVTTTILAIIIICMIVVVIYLIKKLKSQRQVVETPEYGNE
ncbi:8539_t:CDS:2, partial [Racocetra fulgida]